ncbi:MAG: hypothetical protein ACFFKA_18750 [Candidatus Thorarchaeota archaeon]
MRWKVIFNQQVPIKNFNQNLNRTLEPNIEYLMNGDMLKVIKRVYGMRIKNIEEVNWITPIPIKDAKNLLIYRSGGIGDILFILPYLSEIKKVNPEIKISFCSMPNHHEILKLSNYIDFILEDPIEYSKVAGKFDKIILFENFIENNPIAEKVSAMDLAEQFFDGIKKGPIDTKIIPIKPKGDKIHIMIFWISTTKVRDISPAIIFDFLHNLDSEKFRVTMVAPPNEEIALMEIAENVNKYNSKIELRKLVSPEFGKVMEYMLLIDSPHIAIGPDTGLLNLLGYHGIPIIGLFGPFDSKLRLKYYKHAIGIDPITNCMFGKNESGSCFNHSGGSCPLGDFKDELYSPCIHKINADHINIAVQFILKEVYYQ